MSTRKRRAAFDPNALSDLDDLLPPLNLVRDAAAAGANASESGTNDDRSTSRSQPTTSDQSPDENDAVGAESGDVIPDGVGSLGTRESSRPQMPRDLAQNEVAGFKEPLASVAIPNDSEERQGPSRRADARRKTSKRDTSANVNRIAPPEVALPEEVYSALRSLTLEERSTSPTTARSYGQVVLDAVEEHANELKAHWTNAAAASNTGLFRRADTGKPARRRHNAPRARVPLAGVINSDAVVLDQLASDWGAGSRSALVEQALRLYLRIG